MHGRHARSCPYSLCCAWLRSSVAARSQSAFDGPQPLRAVTHTPDPINLQAAYVLGAHSIHSLDYQPAFTMLRAQWRQKWRKVCVWQSFFITLPFPCWNNGLRCTLNLDFRSSNYNIHYLKNKCTWDWGVSMGGLNVVSCFRILKQLLLYRRHSVLRKGIDEPKYARGFH